MLPGSSRILGSRSAGPIQVPLGVEPAYCRRCGLSADPDHQLCRHCGEIQEPCGYCPTCEAFWQRSVGSLCPKHDVELEESPPTPPLLVDPGQNTERWVTVATYAHPNEATGPRIRLEAEGVPTFLDGARIAGATLYQVATGGVRLQVPESLAGSARILLTQSWTILPNEPTANELDDDDPWVGLAPDLGTRRRTVMKGVILILLFGPGLMTIGTMVARGLGWLR